MTIASRVGENLRQVEQSIREAALRSGRPADEITLIAVTKYASDAAAQCLLELGCVNLGESRPQELWRKAALAGFEKARWHLVGHLQRNKVARSLPIATLVHSADSLRLLRAIDAEAFRLGLNAVPVLLEVNISGDGEKHGFQPNEVEPLVESLAAFKSVRVGGLMAMAGRETGREGARRDFAALRQLRDRLRAAWGQDWPLEELSMGMSDDFDIAIEEGATLVRVGSALFEGVE